MEGPGYRDVVQLVPQNRSTIGYMALVVLLVAGLAIGVALFVLQTRGPVGSADLLVAPAAPVDCPRGTGAPVCYVFDVTNAGGGAEPMECLVVPAGGGKAIFTASESDLYQSDGPVAVGDTYSLYAEVTPAEGETEVGRPEVVCRAAS